MASDNGALTIRGRLMTINAINLVPGPTGFPQITATVSATTYIVPPTEGPFGGATPAGPAPTTQAQASTSGSSTRLDPARCGDHPGAAMSVPRNMLKELLERKLWPIALVLIIALVAVPVLLTKKAPTDIVTPPTGPLPYSSGTTLPAISVQTTPGNSKLAGKGRNPFTPQHVATTTTTTAVVPRRPRPTTAVHGHGRTVNRRAAARARGERRRAARPAPRRRPP